MVKRASWLKTAFYVKCSSVSLMRAYGGCWDRHESLPHPISLARLEKPRVIPNFHRRLIRRHDVRADRLVKMYLSMFSVSKLILVPKQSNYQFSSIVDDPSTDIESVLEKYGILVKDLFLRYVPELPSILMGVGLN